MKTDEIRVLELELSFRTNSYTKWWVDNFMHRDRVGLEADGHAFRSEVADVMLIDIMLTPRALNKFDISWVEMQLEEFGKRISLHFFRNRYERRCRTTDTTST